MSLFITQVGGRLLTMNDRTRVLIFVILLFTSMLGMAWWVFWDYKQLKRKKANNETAKKRTT